jgi:hypothetical protein
MKNASCVGSFLFGPPMHSVKAIFAVPEHLTVVVKCHLTVVAPVNSVSFTGHTNREDIGIMA